MTLSDTPDNPDTPLSNLESARVVTHTVFPALVRLEQDDPDFQASLRYT